MKKRTLIFTVMSLITILNLSANTYHFDRIAHNQNLRTLCKSFLSAVLRLETSELLDPICDDVLKDSVAKNDTEYYIEIQKSASLLNPHYDIPYKINLVQYQKNLLSQQAHQLLTLDTPLKGALEIGTPGTYLSGILAKISYNGHIYVINEKQQLSDYAQAFSLNPSTNFLIYDTFVPLNGYEPISSNIADNSLDLCVCFIGLHHIPQEKLEQFVASIARVLRPGGTFLLRDHDACNDDVTALAYAAHSLFNILVPHETVETEIAEYRNFQPLSFWIDLLAKYGLQANEQRLLQDGDPTLNTLLTFTKIANPQDKEKIICAKLHAKTAIRDQLQTYLTAPEWYNVDIAQNYGSFINHTPFYEYPYWASATTYWKIFACSIHAAAKKQGLFKALTNPYNLMNMFIGTTMSIEYAAKALLSCPIRFMYSGQEDPVIQVLLKDPDNVIETLHNNIKTVHSDVDTQIKLVEIPRYKYFLDILQQISLSNIELYEIAGHSQIAFKIRYANSKQSMIEQELNTSHAQQEYYWTIETEPNMTYAVISVNVAHIKSIIQWLQTKNIELLYIHDF